MRNQVKRCVLCRSDDITADAEHDRIFIIACRECGAAVRVEFDPPDDPGLRGRIEVLVEPTDPAPAAPIQPRSRGRR
jgi:hypothetical protein